MKETIPTQATKGYRRCRPAKLLYTEIG